MYITAATATAARVDRKTDLEVVRGVENVVGDGLRVDHPLHLRVPVADEVLIQTTFET
jgi:alpha-D-ribose 1-methylphosphonate 5-triphosphate diphosphatase PhnM